MSNSTQGHPDTHREQVKKNSNPTNHKITEISTGLSMISLTVTGFNSSTKRHRLADRFKTRSNDRFQKQTKQNAHLLLQTKDGAVYTVS